MKILYTLVELYNKPVGWYTKTWLRIFIMDINLLKLAAKNIIIIN